MNAKNRRRYFYAQRDARRNNKKKKSLHHIDATPRVELIYALIDARFDPFYAGIGDDRRPCLLRGREIGKIIERETRGIILYSGLTSWQLRTWRRVVGAGCGTWRGWTECRRHSRNFCFAVSINDRFNKPAYRPATTPRDGQIENFSIKKFMQRLC